MGAVELEVRDGVAVLVLNRPDAQNAINLELARALDDATSRIDGVGCVLFTAAGKTFCAGGDLKEFATQSDMSAHIRTVVGHVHAAIRRIDALAVPVVAAIRGAAAGAGLGLACGADIVLASTSARFASAFTRIALTPDGSTTWILPRIIGMRRALELVLTNRVLEADEALDWGIVTAVVDDDALDDRAFEVARSLASGSTHALGNARRLVRTSIGRTLDEQLDAEAESLVGSGARPDAVEGIAAFLEKRAPRYGR